MESNEPTSESEQFRFCCSRKNPVLQCVPFSVIFEGFKKKNERFMGSDIFPIWEMSACHHPQARPNSQRSLLKKRCSSIFYHNMLVKKMCPSNWIISRFLYSWVFELSSPYNVSVAFHSLYTISPFLIPVIYKIP